MSHIPVFLNPHWLWLSLLAIPAAYSVWASGKYVSFVRRPESAKPAFPWRPVRAACAAVAIVSASAIVADPRYESVRSEEKTRGIDAVFVLDLSKSMLAEDIEPNRLENAKRVIASFVSQREGDRFWLVGFAGKPFLFSPVTDSKASFSEILSKITTDSIRQEMPGLSGTAMGDGLLLASESLSGSAREKVAIVVTDGEANVGLDPEPVAKYVAEKGIRIFTVGIGDPKGTDLFVTDPFTGEKRFFIGGDGKPIRAVVDEPLLKEISGMSRGEYGLAKNAESLENVFKRINEVTKTETSQVIEKRYADASAPFVLIFSASYLAFAALRRRGAENQPA